jgi:hypothetical protein
VTRQTSRFRHLPEATEIGERVQADIADHPTDRVDQMVVDAQVVVEHMTESHVPFGVVQPVGRAQIARQDAVQTRYDSGTGHVERPEQTVEPATASVVVGRRRSGLRCLRVVRRQDVGHQLAVGRLNRLDFVVPARGGTALG